MPLSRDEILKRMQQESSKKNRSDLKSDKKMKGNKQYDDKSDSDINISKKEMKQDKYAISNSSELKSEQLGKREKYRQDNGIAEFRSEKKNAKKNVAELPVTDINTDLDKFKIKADSKVDFRLLTKKQRQHRILLRCGAVLCVLAGLTTAGVKAKDKYEPFFYNNIVQGDRISSTVNSSMFMSKEPTEILDGNGKVMKKLTTLSTVGKYVHLKDVNPYLKKGLVAVEDKRFYQHHGVDPYGTTRALVADKLHGTSQGGSTLTQQLVKNVVLKDQSQTATRKLREMVIAQNLEKKYSKDQILEFYLNNVAYNHSNLGIAQAARYYFGKNQKDLSIGQCALLVGMINNPTLYDPISNPKVATVKRNDILNVWLRNKVINKTEFNSAVKEPLHLKITPTKVSNSVSKNYAMSYALDQAVVELMHLQGFSEQYWFNTRKEKTAYQKRYNAAYAIAREQILSGGYKIHTDINNNHQKELQKIVAGVIGTDLNNPLQTAITVIDNSTGQVIGMQGGKNPKDGKPNRAYLKYNQMGSTSKMIVDYPNAFATGKVLPQTIVNDSPVKNGPQNWDRKFRGPVTVQRAISESLNTVAFKLMLKQNPKTYINQLETMQYDNLGPDDKNAIIAIGGWQYGITTTQAASSYSALARQGKWIAPTNVTEITANGKTIYRNPQKEIPVYTPAGSYLSLVTMSGVMHDKDGSGKQFMPYNSPYAVGKTGTTDNNSSVSFGMISPQYTVFTWVGYDKSGGVLSGNQLNYAGILAKKTMEYYSKGSKKVPFKKPANVSKVGNKYYVSKSQRKATDAELLSEQAKSTAKKRAKANSKRLSGLAYRIKYHLTLKQEQAREDAVRRYLNQVNLTQFHQLSQLPHYNELLNKAKTQNSYVRRVSYRKKFNKEILQKQYKLIQMQAQITAQKQAARNDELERAKQAAMDKVKAKNASKITELKSELKSQKAKVKQAYENDDPDKEQQKAKLADIIDKLRSYGVQQPDENITILER